ncbi:protein FAR-RED IMPAIRED RESPONSE 1-like [Arachis stenosperma]|uniref:protein FAR-RED IMPAIRED RESPONSE 1-like n=1 Tax=Arachis stenosperma TaxID=217475 RepID=UPI0025ACCC75|nr:protein FAR-RED IMPAIRED RESPONSE 1-like [Arachis stenosperma]
MKEKNQNFFFELNLEGDHCIKHAFFADARSRAAFEYLGDVVSFDTTYNINRNWNDFLTKYGLEGNKWLLELYKDWHIWIPMYLDHHFWTGMRRTQKSESMHSFFNKFITRNSSLRQFVKQYDNCLASREQAEREFNAADFYSVIPCATKSVIEAQFQHVSNSTFNRFVVTYDAVSRDVKCHCLLFESRGILCRHSLSVLSFERVDNVAPKYILEHWRKNIKKRHTHWCTKM